MDAIDGLCHIRHHNLIRVPVKDVECDRRMESIPKRERLAKQIGRCYFLPAPVPHTPLVNHQLGVVIGVVFTDRLPMLLDDILGPQAFANHVVPSPRIERGYFFGTVSKVCVVVHRETIYPRVVAVLHGIEETRRPAEVEIFRMTARPDRDQKWLWFVGRKLGDEPPVQRGILGGSHISTATPRLVAHTPETNAEWLLVTVYRSLVCQRHSACQSVAIRHPIMELSRGTRPHVCGEVRLCTAQAAQVHELVNSKLVGLGLVHALRHACLPVVIGTGAFCRFSDAISPVVAVSKTAARPAIVRHANALHVVDELLANAADILDLRVPSHPDPVVNNSAEMLDELPV